jgi:hypothetical protein
MTERVKMGWIKSQIEQIEALTGIKLKITAWSPGDGKVRYTILAGNEGSGIGRVALGKSELFDMLKAINGFVHYGMMAGKLASRDNGNRNLFNREVEA